MSNTLVYAVKQCISVFLISKYNIDSDFCLCHITIKAQAAVKCPNCSPWNVLTRMHRKKDRRLYIDGCTVEGVTNRESLDNQYGYLSVNGSFRKTHI